jgi:hypothetical protein
LWITGGDVHDLGLQQGDLLQSNVSRVTLLQ